MSTADYGIKLYLSFKEWQTGTFVQLSRDRDFVCPIYHDFLAFFEMIEAHPYHGPRIISLFIAQFYEYWYVCELRDDLQLTFTSQLHCSESLDQIEPMLVSQPARMFPHGGNLCSIQTAIPWNIDVDGVMLPETGARITARLDEYGLPKIGSFPETIAILQMGGPGPSLLS
jgi:hypothetical protein